MIVLATSKNALELSEEDFTLVDALGVLGVEAKLVDWADEHFDWRRARLVVIRTTWDYHYRLPEFIAWLDRVSEFVEIVNPPELLKWNANKRYLGELEAKGVPIVPTEYVSGPTDVRRLAEGRGWHTVVVKPTVAAGAYETLVFPMEAEADQAQAQAHVDRLLQRGDVMVQPYLDAITVEGETSLVYFEGGFSHAVRKVPAAGDFRVQIEFGGRYTVVEPTAAQLEVGNLVVDSAPLMPLYARIDLVDIDGRPHLMEAEMIEPEMFFLFVPEAAVVYADLLRERLSERLVG